MLDADVARKGGCGLWERKSRGWAAVESGKLKRWMTPKARNRLPQSLLGHFWTALCSNYSSAKAAVQLHNCNPKGLARLRHVAAEVPSPPKCAPFAKRHCCSGCPLLVQRALPVAMPSTSFPLHFPPAPRQAARLVSPVNSPYPRVPRKPAHRGSK